MKLWAPTADYIEKSEMTAFKEFTEDRFRVSIGDYEQLREWSVTHLEDFWESIFLYFQVMSDTPYSQVLNRSEQGFIGSKWFEGATLNYAEHIFRNYTDERPAVIYKNEQAETREISWKELQERTGALRQYLLRCGVGKGDRVAGVLNNTPETLAIFLAVNSLGAIWTCCSPDFGSDSVVERFQQISPKILFADKLYHYNGKTFRKSRLINELAERIDSIEDVVVVNDLKWRSIFALAKKGQPLAFDRVAFDHPVWILYSSGTTGKPKAITHSTGGNLLEHFKALALHQNVQAGERFMWYSTTGWMMWNYAVGALLTGATLCIYDGSLSYPALSVGWKFAFDHKIDHFGAGAAYFIACAKRNPVLPNIPFKTLGSTGSPLPADTFEWLQLKFPDTQIISLSGGTDVCSAFLSGCPWLPVYAGEIQCIALGADIEALNENGEPVKNELGELVINQPMPSMPLYFWNDEGNVRYRESYFEKYPGRWQHGDWIKITENNGIIIYGRSDATLNRGGVRIGTAEIYNAIEEMVQDSLVVCIDHPNGSSEMYLYVQTEEPLSSKTEKAIRERLKSRCSPRHVPDKIFRVPDIPYTLSGKKLELPVKRLLMGASPEKAVSMDAVKNPAALDYWLKKQG
ncbi:acetoacetate--CoA ligase [Leadbetterella sp. DM7]|uniref:acetoacetate--CoA ligase n=1 Tax=Leadbetterella sp. DM7 TaxID=3235085 RepID=UPI00349EA1F0